MTEHRKLTDRQGRFVREYLVDLNATRAAIRAGNSRRGAGRRGWILRQIPAVAAAIAAVQVDEGGSAGGARGEAGENQAGRQVAQP